MKKIVLGVLVLVGIVLLSVIAMATYISFNKEVLRKKIIEKIRERTRGEVVIGSVSPAFFETFPFISVELNNVILRDSAFAIHKKDLLTARKIFLETSLFHILKDSKLKAVSFEDGRINLFRDSTYNNTYIFKTSNKEKDDSDEPSAADYPDIRMKNMEISFKNPNRNKDHGILAKKLVASIEHDNKKLVISTKSDMMIRQIAFNTTKGGYLTNTSWKASFELEYDKKTRTLSFPKQRIDLNDHPYYFSGTFRIDDQSPDFQLDITSKDTRFQHAASLLPKRTYTKLEEYRLSGPVSINISVTGKTSSGFKPLVKATVKAPATDLKTNFIHLVNCSFEASFNNEIAVGQVRDDKNSEIRISNFQGMLGKIPLKIDSLIITNLKEPELNGHLVSNFPLKDLNEQTGSSTLKFRTGTGRINVHYQGPISGDNQSSPGLTGIISLNDAGLDYIPRGFVMNDGNGDILFKDNHLLVRSLTMNTGKTNLTMNGRAENFLTLLKVSPEKLILQWNIKSRKIFLEDYKGFLSSPVKKEKKSNIAATFSKTAEKIDKMLLDGDARLNLDAAALNYNKFDAQNLKARVLLTPAAAKLEEVSMDHARGKISMKGIVDKTSLHNVVDITANLNKVYLPVLFESFSDFGQDAIQSKNVEGSITADVTLHALVTEKGTVLRDKTKGKVNFLIENFELNNFEPIQKLSEKVFKKQDFSRIKFADLENSLIIDGSAYIMDRMDIRSTALVFSVKGVYDVEKGTDMGIILPIKNLLKNNANLELSDEGRNQSGISIRLRAKTGEDGKLAIGWDPLRRGGRK